MQQQLVAPSVSVTQLAAAKGALQVQQQQPPQQQQEVLGIRLRTSGLPIS
jgi:hypothetical protein